MAKTFFALLKLADVDHSGVPPKPPGIEAEKDDEDEVDTKRERKQQKHTATTGLHYNIQIHLPATKDVEVYNAIFKSLKEHLIG